MFSKIRGCRGAIALACFSLLLVVAAPVSLAAPIPYSDQLGVTVDYVDISEVSLTDPGTALYGAPSIVGDELSFSPGGFGATSSNGGIDFVDGQLNFTICSQDDQTIIDNIMLSEAGDFTLLGAGTAATYVSVSAPAIITITEVDGGAVPGGSIQLLTNMTFTPVGNLPPPGASYNLTTHPGIGLGWSAKLMVDIQQLLIDEQVDFDFGATKVKVAVDNTMFASSEAGTVAFIAKKDFRGFSVTTNVPEPSTCVLGMLGLAMLGNLRRAKR
jgi:hypothetical protein